MKKINQIKNNIRINKKLFVFLLFLIISGLISGSIFSIVITAHDKKIVSNYLIEFINNCKSGILINKHNLTNNIFFSFSEAAMIYLLGYSVLGFFVILFLLFIKSFILGFSLGSIYINFKAKGILLGLVYTFPDKIINLCIYMILSYYALLVSYKIIRSIKGIDNLNLKETSKKYFLILIISLVFIMISNLYQVYIIPKLIKTIM